MNEEKETILTRIEGSGIYRRIRNKTNRKLVDFLKRYALGDKTSAVVLEAAGGSGYSAHLMAQDRQVSLSVNLDINLTLSRQAGIKNFQADMVIADIYSMPFRNGTFDLIWNSSSVEELPDPGRAIENMASLVRPGGYVFTGVPYLYGPLALYYLLPGRKVREWVGKPFSHKRLRGLFEDAGLRVERKITYLARFFTGILARRPE